MNLFFVADVSKDACRIIPNGSVNFVVTSPPYKAKDGYSLRLMRNLGEVIGRVLTFDGRVFLNFGQLKPKGGFSRPMDAARAFAVASGLERGQTIIWVKSLVVDGKQRGHYQPLPGGQVLNYCWEFVFTFHRKRPRPLDRLSVGVPFADKSNMKRGTRGKNGDLHCAGDVWFIPHKTTGATTKKAHGHEFPAELVRRCLKVSSAVPGDTLWEPFLGGGTSTRVAAELGLRVFGSDICPGAVTQAQR